MLLDGLHRHEQRLRDLLVAQVFSRQVRDPPLARGELVETAQQDRSAVGAGRRELVIRTLHERCCAAPLRELDPVTQ